NEEAHSPVARDIAPRPCRRGRLTSRRRCNDRVIRRLPRVGWPHIKRLAVIAWPHRIAVKLLVAGVAGWIHAVAVLLPIPAAILLAVGRRILVLGVSLSVGNRRDVINTHRPGS